MGASTSKQNAVSSPFPVLYDVPDEDLHNFNHSLPVSLSEYKGKVIVFVTATAIVNLLAQHTAKGLQAAVDKFGKRFVVVLIPIGHDLDLIRERWMDHGLKDFVLLEPITVVSKGQHALITWLRAKTDFRPLFRPNQKIMVNTEGSVYYRWGEDMIPETPAECEEGEPNVIGLCDHIKRCLDGAATPGPDYVPPRSTFAQKVVKPGTAMASPSA